MYSTSIKEVIGRATSWLKMLADFGVMLIITFIIIDILFPGTTGIIENLIEVIQLATGNVESAANEATTANKATATATGSNRGLVGLIALLMFLLLLRRNK